MMKRTTFLILCLLMTTPYVIGGESAVRESEIPNAHSMVRKTVRKKVRVVSAKADELSQRQQTLLIAGDEHYMPRASVDFESKKFYSLLPLEVRDFQNSKSPLAYFIRLTLWSAGLSKTVTKKLVKPYFPSKSQINKEARREGVDQKVVRQDYCFRQVVLHQYCSQLVHSKWTQSYVDLQNSHKRKLIVLNKALDAVGGVSEPYKDKINATKKEIQQTKKTFATKIRNNRVLFQNISDWASKGEVVQRECLAHSFVSESMVGKLRVKIYKAAHKACFAKRQQHEEDEQQIVQRLSANVTLFNEATTKHNSLAYEFIEAIAQHEKDLTNFNTILVKLSNVVNFTNYIAPWASTGMATRVVQENYVLNMLTKAEDSEVDFAFLHHPELIRPQAINATSLSQMMSENINLEENISIPKTELKLFLPKGVLATLGTKFNQVWNEGDTFREKWAGDKYDWKAVSHQVHEEKELDKQMQDLKVNLSRFKI